MANTTTIGSVGNGSQTSIYDAIKAAVTLEPREAGDAIVTVSGRNGESVPFGNQFAAFVLKVSLVEDPIFRQIASAGGGSDNPTFRAAFARWQGALAAIFGTSDIETVRGRFIAGDGKIVDGTLFTAWAQALMSTALACDIVHGIAEQHSADPFGFGNAASQLADVLKFGAIAIVALLLFMKEA